MKNLTKILMVAVFAIMISCSKDGAVGPAGPAGTNGTNGTNGNANVMYSDWFTPNPWVVTTIYGTKDFAYAKSETAITQSILDNGVVLVFGKLSGYSTSIWPTNQVAQLPILINYQNGTVGEIDTWSANLSLGSISIDMKNNTNVYSSILTTHSFRYVIIPATNHLRFKKPLTQMTYDEVCELYNIPK